MSKATIPNIDSTMTVERKYTLSYRAFQDGLNNYTPAEADLVTWLWGYYNSQIERNWQRLCLELGNSDWENQVRPLFSGRVPASVRAELFDAIAALKKRIARKKPIVPTVVTERIIQALDYARDFSRMVYIAGPTGRGKTYTAQWWQSQNNHGRTVYLRVPSDCTRRALVNLLCEKRGVAHSCSCADCEENLRRTLSPRNVLIIDEAGHLLSKSGRPGGAIELLRDLHDMTGCGVALIITDVYLAEIKRGRNAAYFEQFLGRLEFPVEIPKIPRRDEVRQALCAYFDDPDEDLVAYALGLASSGDGQLRTLYNDLVRAEEYANSKNRRMTSDDLKAAAKWRKSSGAWPEDK